MDVLVTGASGLLGSNVLTEALSRNHSVVGTYHSTRPEHDISLRPLDVRDTDEFVKLLDEFEPSVVINCAAMTDVDECENDPERAAETNHRAPETLSSACAERGLDFVHISTDYVFDGQSDRRYREDSDPNPIQTYGRSKLAGERAVRSTHSAALVVRPSFIYGLNRTCNTPSMEGFPAWVLSRLEADESVPLFTDQHVTPSRASSTAATLLDLVETAAKGVYHIASRSCVTPYEFGRQLARQFGYREELLAESSQAEVKREATRPSNTCLSVTKVETHLDRPQPTVKQDVQGLADER